MNAIFATRVNWPVARARAAELSAGAHSPADTYNAIRDVLARLHDPHARLVEPARAPAQGQQGSTFATPVLRRERVRLGYIQLFGFPPTGDARAYETAALVEEARLAAAGVCGWIIDLRLDTGGSPNPMLQVVGPIAGAGKLVGFRDRAGRTRWITYTGSGLDTPTGLEPAPVAPPRRVSPSSPVAIVTGAGTFSAGEGVAIAFRGRADVRSFGAPTGGGPDPIESFRLSDGAALVFATREGVDRTGRVYAGPMKPDVAVPADADPIGVADAWLLGTAACAG